MEFCQDALNKERQDLRTAINEWRARCRKLFPQAFPFVSTDRAENETLEVPSSYTVHRRQLFGLDALSYFEY
jgi:hypothetical protein